jgi:hypothetical protein
MSGSVPGAIQPITPYQQPDVIGQAGQFAQIKNQLLSNQANQQQLNARNALGALYSQATNPDGTINGPLLQNLVAQSPQASYLAPEVAQQAQERQLAQYQLNQAQLAQTQARLAPYKAAMGTLISDPNPTTAKIYNVLNAVSGAGTPTDAIAGDIAASMPVADPAQAGNPAYQAQYKQSLHSWLQNQWGSGLSGEAQANVFRPTLAPINTGGGITLQDVNPTTNPGGAGTVLTNTLSPEAAVGGQHFTTPGGTPYFETNSQLAQQTGNGNLVAGGAGGGGAAPGASIFGTGRLPGRGAPYSGPTAGSPAPAIGGSAVPPGTLQTGLPPGQAAGADVAAAGSANDLHSLYSSVATSGARLYQLNTALSSLQALGTTGTGPGTAERNNIASYLQSIPLLGSIMPGVNPTKIANFDEATKYLTAYASNQASNMGAGTDAKLATALSGNASTHISNLAATNVVKATIGLERMQQAQAQAFQQSGLPAAQYDQWSTNWNKTTDARAYAFDLMSPQQRGTMLKGMSPGQQTNFFNQVWSASQNGFIDPGKSGLPTGSSASGAPAAAPPPASSAPPPGAVPNPAQPGATYVPAVPVTP